MYNIRQVCFSGEVIETTICDRAEVVDRWVRSLLLNHPGEEIIVGMDCEWKPNTTPSMNNRTATLQLCVGTKCIIIQLIYLDYVPQSLKDFFSNQSVVFVGVEVDRDAQKLRIEYGLDCARTADVRYVALNRAPYNVMCCSNPGLEEIARVVVGLNMLKPRHVSLSDWQSRVLDDAQVEYACIDAYASYRIGCKLLKDDYA